MEAFERILRKVLLEVGFGKKCEMNGIRITTWNRDNNTKKCKLHNIVQLMIRGRIVWNSLILSSKSLDYSANSAFMMM